MLRRTRPHRLMEGIHYRIPDVATLELRAHDIDQNSFHTSCMPGLYDRVSEMTAFSRCEKLFNRRIITAVPCTLNKKCLRVPMLVDTGVPSTYLHTFALKKFYGNEDFPNEFDMYVGTHPLRAKHNNDSTGTSVLSHLNILGMDFLDSALPQLLPWLSDKLSKFQSPLDEVIVTDGNSTFGVTPSKPVVWALKDAIMPKRAVACAHIDADRIIIKLPDGTKLGDKDPLFANIKYVFEVPPPKQ